MSAATASRGKTTINSTSTMCSRVIKIRGQRTTSTTASQKPLHEHHAPDRMRTSVFSTARGQGKMKHRQFMHKKFSMTQSSTTFQILSAAWRVTAQHSIILLRTSSRTQRDNNKGNTQNRKSVLQKSLYIRRFGTNITAAHIAYTA